MTLEKLKNRVLLEADLVPTQGARFQPTGFADLGAAVYSLPNGTRMLLVESAQSMANRLESTITTPEGQAVSEVAGISYMTATLKGDGIPETVVSSLTEPHRLASPFIIADKEFQSRFCKEAGYEAKGKLDWPRINRTIFKYDVNSILHGVFLSAVEGGRIKVPRLISSFIEASNVREVVSGGVKNSIDPTGSIRHKEYDKEVYGNVPYQRTEYTAERITAYFNLDVAGIRGLGLPQEAQELLCLLGLYKVRRLLDGELRLRTACDLRLAGDVRTDGIEELPDAMTLLENLQQAIAACKGLFADPAVTELTAPVIEKKKSKQESTEGEDD